MIKLRKHTVHSQKGKGVVYTLTNIRFDQKDNKLKWDAFRFYTPPGNLTDDDGYKYFEVGAEEYLLERGLKNKRLIIKVDMYNGLNAIECDSDAERDGIIMGLEGDIIIRGFIPADAGRDITIDYMEVLG